VPKIVDHEERRREVTKVAAKLVIQHGRAALTVRNVAEAAGCSTTVVSHYFDDMADLFFETYNYAAGRSRERIEAVLSADPGDIIGLIEAVLPLDQERTDDWRIWFAFWSEALHSPRFADEQRQRAIAQTARIKKCLSTRVKKQNGATKIDIVATADRLSALIPGIASEAIFDATTWSPARQRKVLRSELALLGL
jgi:AcrR family transcriptional regulator